jgi:hypothetical protein
MMYSRAVRVFILTRYFESKSGLCSWSFLQCVSSQEGGEKAKIRLVVTSFRVTGSVCHREHAWDCLFQHIGATAHTANIRTTLLQEFFGERLVGRRHCLPQSPELPQSDFFLWGFLREGVYSLTPWRFSELILNVGQSVAPTLTQKHLAKSHETN